MAEDADEEDYIFVGTPLEREEELNPRKRQKAVEEGRARTLPAWKQEVTDEEGRRRFHGAFTGGFSAGYFNTVGSKAGWAPATFVSSRSKRAEKKAQAAYDFMDEDEKAAVDERTLGTASEFDTFGSTAAEIARKVAEQEAGKRPAAIPGPIPDELVVPAADSTGVKLLRKMGWRPGRAVGPAHEAASAEARRRGRRAMLALATGDRGATEPEPRSHWQPRQEGAQPGGPKKVYGAALPPPPGGGLGRGKVQDKGKEEEEEEQEQEEEEEEEEEEVPATTPVYVVTPKTNFHGLGFDPYQHAPEFRAAKGAKAGAHPLASSGGGALGLGGRRADPGGSIKAPGRGSLFRPMGGTMGTGFGIGALEEIGEEDEDIYAPEIEVDMGASEEDEEGPTGRGPAGQMAPPPGVPRIEVARAGGASLPGFRLGSAVADEMKWFPPPAVPRGFVPTHRFPAPLESAEGAAHGGPVPPEAAPPSDPAVRSAIEGLAAFVARLGQQFEDLAREKNVGNPVFEFLFGGSGRGYYMRRVWEARQKRTKEGGGAPAVGQAGLGGAETRREKDKLDAEGRGSLLGERPLPREAVSVEALIAPEDKARLQAALAGQFERGRQQDMAATPDAKPFQSDPAKQARFERYLLDQSRGGLRRPSPAGGSGLTERERASEAADFERASAMLRQAQAAPAAGTAGAGRPAASANESSSSRASELAAMVGSRFTSGGSEMSILPPGLGSAQQLSQSAGATSAPEAVHPQRDEAAWRPAPLLCKRYNVLDPFAGKGPPPPKPKSRTESLALLASPSHASSQPRAAAPSPMLALPAPPPQELPPGAPARLPTGTRSGGGGQLARAGAAAAAEEEEEVTAEEVVGEKPIDLFKAIFSDEESGEDDITEEGTSAGPSLGRAFGSEAGPGSRAAEAAAKALSRLEAGDFLESLGSELGLAVPPPPIAVAVGAVSATAPPMDASKGEQRREGERGALGRKAGREGAWGGDRGLGIAGGRNGERGEGQHRERRGKGPGEASHEAREGVNGKDRLRSFSEGLKRSDVEEPGRGEGGGEEGGGLLGSGRTKGGPARWQLEEGAASAEHNAGELKGSVRFAEGEGIEKEKGKRREASSGEEKAGEERGKIEREGRESESSDSSGSESEEDRRRQERRRDRRKRKEERRERRKKRKGKEGRRRDEEKDSRRKEKESHHGRKQKQEKEDHKRSKVKDK